MDWLINYGKCPPSSLVVSGPCFACVDIFLVGSHFEDVSTPGTHRLGCWASELWGPTVLSPRLTCNPSFFGFGTSCLDPVKPVPPLYVPLLSPGLLLTLPPASWFSSLPCLASWLVLPLSPLLGKLWACTLSLWGRPDGCTSSCLLWSGQCLTLGSFCYEKWDREALSAKWLG